MIWQNEKMLLTVVDVSADLSGSPLRGASFGALECLSLSELVLSDTLQTT